MVVKVRLENGRETWLDPSNPETIKAIENQYGSKVVLIDGKAYNKATYGTRVRKKSGPLQDGEIYENLLDERQDLRELANDVSTRIPTTSNPEYRKALASNLRVEADNIVKMGENFLTIGKYAKRGTKFIGVPEIPGYAFMWYEQKAQYDGSKPTIVSYKDRNKAKPKEQLKVTQAERIEYFKGEMSNNRWVDALLYKNKYGQIIGILNHYPFDFPPYEKKGNINVMVAPKEQGKGIGLKLVKEALNRYPDIDLYQQEWTPQGQSLLKQIGADKNYFKFFQEYAINEKYTKKMTDIGVDKETNDNSIYDSNKDEIQIFTKYNNLKQLWYISGTQLMKCKTLMDFTKSLKKRGTMKERKAEHGIKFEQYDDESYPSQYDWLVKTITKFFGQMNINRSSADWGGIDNWTIKGGMYEGIFIIIDDNNKVVLMERKHNEETEENEDTDLAEAEPSETKELEVLFKKAMSIKEEKLGYGDKAEHGKKVSEMNNEDKVQKYIDYYMNGDMSVIFDTIGLDMPTELEGDEYEETMELAREQADRIFTLNPDMMTNKFGDPFDFSLATDKAKKGVKIGENGGFVKDDQGNYKNSKGFELINQFDGTYQVLDKNGMDISGEYETLKQAKQTIKDFELFENQDQTMKTGGVTNEPLYNVEAKTLGATKIYTEPDMYSKLTKSAVIELANTMSYYERMDNDEPEIPTFALAKKFIEDGGDWKVTKIAKQGTETSEVRFLSKDHSGRGERPYILNESHIRKTWDLKEVGDDDETSLGDFLNNSEPGDTWRSGTESLENLGIGMSLGGYTLTRYTKEQQKLLKDLDKRFREEEPGTKERMEILQQMHNVQKMEHGGSFETEQEPGKYIFKDTEKAMLKNAFLFLKNATQTDDYFVIELSYDGHEYMVDWFALDGTDEGSVGYFKHYHNALKKFNEIREYIKSNWNIVAEKIDVPYEKNESNGEVHYDAPDVMELIGKASKGFKFQPWLYGKRGIKTGSIASWYGNKSQAKRGTKFGVNKKYTHFAVSKSTGKIMSGWETISDIESLKYYAKSDLKDMDLNPNDYKILSKAHLLRMGVDPFNWDNWQKNEPTQAKRGAKTDNSVQFIDYKGEEIMFESINKEYFVNDLEFKTLAEAKKYIDSGSPLSDAQINLYRHGAMKQGGKLKPYPDLSRKEPMVIKDDLFDTFTPEKPTLIKEKKSKKDTGTLTNIIPQVELVRMGVQTLENIGDRKITDSKSATKILYKVFPKNQIGVQEFYYALYTDRANNVIAYYNLSKGGVSGTIADAELVGSVGIKLLAQGVLVAHNHPSGNLKPSEADIKMALYTKQVLKGLGIALLDSIIIVPGGEPVDKFEGYKYTSLQDEGKI